MNNYSFPTAYADVTQRIDDFDVQAYAKSRNFLNGSVSLLSPYISRGVISTRTVLSRVLAKGHDPRHIEKFIQELAWRDHWQAIWDEKGTAIESDLLREQDDVTNHKLPAAIVNANTSISAIDDEIKALYSSGYMHNHVRMYVAALACNMGKSHWKQPARWMYYHLLDGDIASNHLSWQWVAGSNASKKYLCNQENINKYCATKQVHSFLDKSYEEIASMPVPDALRELTTLVLQTKLPSTAPPRIDETLPTLVYNYYNLDPNWHKGNNANRILLLEPSVFEDYPISENALNFALRLAENIPHIQTFVGEFDALKKWTGNSTIYSKAHPLNKEYTGNIEPRESMFNVTGAHRSFFAFWKKCSKQLYA